MAITLTFHSRKSTLTSVVQSQFMVDLEGHRGLRGLLAVWIMIFHCVLYTKTPVDLQGSSLMPMFIMLSGFSLTVAYGEENHVERQEFNVGYCEVEQQEGINQKSKPLDFPRFYQNRIARIIPVYYLCSLAAIPLWLAGYGSAPPESAYFFMSIVTTFLPLCTFFIFLLGTSLDGPGWTVSTLLVLYLFFPSLLKHVKSLNNEKLQNGVANFYWIQLAIVFIVFLAVVPFLGFWPAFAAATMQPISRLPLFVMGIDSRVANDGDANSDQAYWTKRTDQVTLAAVAIMLAVIAGDTLNRYVSSGEGILGAVWLQAIVPYMHLELMVGLTRDNGSSTVSKLLRAKGMGYLGDLSMCIYLIHFVVLLYITWAFHGSPVNHDHDNYDDATALPFPGI
eukprot:gene40767-49716_t